MIRLEVLDDAEAAGRARPGSSRRRRGRRPRVGPLRLGDQRRRGTGRDVPSSRGAGLPWARIDTWQVDERIAPAGDPTRNRTAQERELPGDALGGVRWMPVEDDDLAGAADRYAAGLPARFDVVHLGIGPDGHTASLVPGDAVLDVADRDVAVTAEPYQGLRRMTLTYPALARCGRAVWYVTGAGSDRPWSACSAAIDRSPPGASRSTTRSWSPTATRRQG